MELDHATAAKFDKVLDSVKEPQSELSIGELGLVKKFSYHAAEKTIAVHLDFEPQGMECPACSAVNGFILSTIQRDLTTALEEEFPGWTIVFP
jgi:metal-sulfur cluster biosynthetic enzyme